MEAKNGQGKRGWPSPKRFSDTCACLFTWGLSLDSSVRTNSGALPLQIPHPLLSLLYNHPEALSVSGLLVIQSCALWHQITDKFQRILQKRHKVWERRQLLGSDTFSLREGSPPPHLPKPKNVSSCSQAASLSCLILVLLAPPLFVLFLYRQEQSLSIL